jgi:hypothetical protein
MGAARVGGLLNAVARRPWSFPAFVDECLPGLLAYAHALTGDPVSAARLVEQVLGWAGGRWWTVARTGWPQEQVKAEIARRYVGEAGSAGGPGGRGRRARAELVLREMEGLSDSEIAAWLRRSRGAVRAQLVRGLVASDAAAGGVGFSSQRWVLPADVAMARRIVGRAGRDRRRGRAAARSAVVAAAVVAGAVVTLTGERAGPAPPEPAAPAGVAGGGIVYLDPDAQRLGLSRPDGTGRSWLTGPVVVGAPSRAALSPDRRWLVIEDGLLLDLAGSGPHEPTSVAAFDQLTQVAVPVQPWADHGRAVVVTGRDVRGPLVRLLDTATRAVLAEWRDGEPDGRAVVAADPRGPAVAVAVPAARTSPSFDGTDFHPTDRVELRGPPGAAVLITADQFGPAAGIAAIDQLDLYQAAFSPDGALLAIAGRTIPARQGDPAFSGLVVLSRSGRIMHVQQAEIGTWWWMGWTGPDALTAVFRDMTRTPPGTRMINWSFPSAAARPHPLPTDPHVAAVANSGCVVAPTDTQLVCGDDHRWLLVDLAHGTTHPLPSAPGRPMAWIPPLGE